MAPLLECMYRIANNIIVSTFYEMLKLDMNTFHMPFGEITIALDDVASLLHIPILGVKVSFLKLKTDDANDILVELL